MRRSCTEQETVITYERAGDVMHVYTEDAALLARLMKQPAYRLIKERRQGGRLIAAEFEADKRLLILKNKRSAMALTDERREVLRERLKAGKRKTEGKQ